MFFANRAVTFLVVRLRMDHLLRRPQVRSSGLVIQCAEPLPDLSAKTMTTAPAACVNASAATQQDLCGKYVIGTKIVLVAH